MNTNGFVDILNALPTSKLISTVSAGIGKLYEPTHIKRIAKAKAEEIKLISGAMEECSVIPTQYCDGSLSLNTLEWDDFVRRTQSRMAFQELQKQNNIECVVANAYNVLETAESCSEEPVEQGWISSFFDSISNVSDEDLQKLWGRILAGEIIQPKSYSLRTLETIKNLSREEAELFKRVAPLVTQLEGDFFLTSEVGILKKYGVSYDDILSLDECGLLNSNGMVSVTCNFSDGESIVLSNQSKLLLIKRIQSAMETISLGVFGLTRAGKELYSIMDLQPNDSFLCDYADNIEKDNKGLISITLHQMYSVSSAGVEYDDIVLREFPAREE